ncbi:MAG: DUF6504 family protein [Dehalococcoidia bacterium]
MPRATQQRLQEIEVGLTGEGADVQPEWIEVRGQRATVQEVMATWAEGGQGPAGRTFNRVNRTFFRVRTKAGSVVEVAHEQPEGRKAGTRWVLVRELPTQSAQEEDSAAATAQTRGEIKPVGQATTTGARRKKTAAGGAAIPATVKSTSRASRTLPPTASP